MPTTESGRLRSRLGHRRMGTVAHPREIPRRTQNAALVVELLARLFAAIGSYPHIVATRAAPIEMTVAMPAKRSENHTVLTPAMWALVADPNLVFRAGESPFGHRRDGTIPSSTVATCATNFEGCRGTTAEFPRILSPRARDAMNPPFLPVAHHNRPLRFFEPSSESVPGDVRLPESKCLGPSSRDVRFTQAEPLPLSTRRKSVGVWLRVVRNAHREARV
jgi:hypothetical protein